MESKFIDIVCQQCGKLDQNRYHTAKYCEECKNKRSYSNWQMSIQEQMEKLKYQHAVNIFRDLDKKLFDHVPAQSAEYKNYVEIKKKYL